MNSKKLLAAAIIIAVFVVGIGKLSAQDKKESSLVQKLENIDPELRKYFPRWKVCEPDLQFQIYQAFSLLGYDKKKLNMQLIVVLASPTAPSDRYYDILQLSCGDVYMNSRQIDEQIKLIGDYLSGRKSYGKGTSLSKKGDISRDYCFDEIPPEIPVTTTQVQAILNYLQPTDVSNAIVLSMFEQSLKIGASDFWISNTIGNDKSGYPFWSSGQGRVILQRPLYTNTNTKTSGPIPNLINAYLGIGYKMNSGKDIEGTVLGWVPKRQLNSTENVKLVAGFDFYMPFKQELGVSFNMELPLMNLKTDDIDQRNYAFYVPSGDVDKRETVDFKDTDPRYYDTNVIGISSLMHGNKNYSIAPIIGATGQFTIFYNWWINKETNPENYFRFDLGLNYTEVYEGLCYRDLYTATNMITFEGIDGITNYMPNTPGDWLFAKVEYRNQATFPFGLSLQYSNQMFLGRVYLPLLGNWLYLEGKYATPLRETRLYETKHFFMISPVLRFTI
ncbi:MAG: hypothetical protein QG635_127 [Bacteroidota bacterium]|nr:hypothetical protein [Bacteroidota bacterium]